MRTPRRVISFVKSEELGVCPACKKMVTSDRPHAKSKDVVFHLTCYKPAKADEE